MVKQINKTINHSFLISRLDKLPTVTTILQYDSAAQLNMYKLSGDVQVMCTVVHAHNVID